MSAPTPTAAHPSIPWPLVAAALVLGALNSACGGMLQYAYGFDEEVTRTSTRTKRIALVGVPEGAVVERHDAAGRTVLGAVSHDEVSYAVSETVAVPRSREPMYVGAALDAVAGGAFAFLALRDDDGLGVSFGYTAAYFGAGLIGDLVFAVLYADTPERVVRYAPLPAPPVRYVVRAREGVFEQRLRVAWADRVVFEDAPGVAEPGGPRLEFPPPPPLMPPPKVAIRPAEKPESSWYGYQILPIDIAAVTMFAVGVSKGNTGLWVSGVAVAGFAPALVHLANGEYMHAGASLGLRVGGPVVAGGLGAGLGALFGLLVSCSGCDPSPSKVGAIILGLAGASTAGLLAPLTDDIFLAWKETPPEATGEPTVTVVPSAGMTVDGRPTFGLAGRF